MNILLSPTPLVLRAGMAGVRLSPEEFDAVICGDDGYRYELINGVLIVTPIPLEAERDPNEELGYLLRRYREDHPQGKTLEKTLFEHTVRTGTNRRRADRVIWAGLGRVVDPKVDVPTIIAEFISGDKRDWLRDYVEKRQEYLALGVAEYWIIDRFRRTMTVCRSQPGLPPEQVVTENEVYRTPLLPGFELPLARLLTAADYWKPSD
jgi:Uma2 family endonuclease